MTTKSKADNTPDAFACRQCGTCCRWPGNVVLIPEDIADLARFLRMTEDAFVQRYTTLSANRKALSLTEKPDGSCLFLEGDRCQVYLARPRQCREFPHGWRVKGCPVLDAAGQGDRCVPVGPVKAGAVSGRVRPDPGPR